MPVAAAVVVEPEFDELQIVSLFAALREVPDAAELSRARPWVTLWKLSRTSPIDDEMRVIKQLKDDGVIKTVYRRAAGPGTFLILEGETIDAIRERVETLPFVVEGLHHARAKGSRMADAASYPREISRRP